MERSRSRPQSPQPSTSGLQECQSCPSKNNAGKRKRQRTSSTDELDSPPVYQGKKPSIPRRPSMNDEISDDSLSKFDVNNESDVDDNSNELSFFDHDNSPADHTANRQKAVNLDDFIHSEYSEEPICKYLPPVSPKLAEAVTRWCHVVPDREKIKTMFTNTLIPDNVPGLNSVRINEVLYQKLSYRVKINDQRSRGINTYITRGLGPIFSSLDKILQFENSLRKDVEIKIEDDTLVVKNSKDNSEIVDFQLNVRELRSQIDQGLRMLTICNSVCL